jgi:DNA-binding protein H-NS
MTKSSTIKVQPMPTFLEIQKQIQALQAQAEELRKVEVEALLGEMKANIELYGITAEQLGFGKPATEAATPASAHAGANNKSVAKSDSSAKYKNPNGPETWAGRGNHPKWVRAHIDAGGTKEDLLIEK